MQGRLRHLGNCFVAQGHVCLPRDQAFLGLKRDHRALELDARLVVATRGARGETQCAIDDPGEVARHMAALVALEIREMEATVHILATLLALVEVLHVGHRGPRHVDRLPRDVVLRTELREPRRGLHRQFQALALTLEFLLRLFHGGLLRGDRIVTDPDLLFVLGLGVVGRPMQLALRRELADDGHAVERRHKSAVVVLGDIRLAVWGVLEAERGAFDHTHLGPKVRLQDPISLRLVQRLPRHPTPGDALLPNDLAANQDAFCWFPIDGGRNGAVVLGFEFNGRNCGVVRGGQLATGDNVDRAAGGVLRRPHSLGDLDNFLRGQWYPCALVALPRNLVVLERNPALDLLSVEGRR
mmetsp:Transcript_124003/g.355972  ORF Transcript_124003/g.355972 Transcript_124003/m.355972 type:complete len:355 (+) Transcript_124003:1190-2254(+)